MSSFIGVEPARSTGPPENHKIFRVVAPVSRTREKTALLPSLA